MDVRSCILAKAIALDKYSASPYRACRVKLETLVELSFSQL